MFADKLHVIMLGGSEVAEPLSRNQGKGRAIRYIVQCFRGLCVQEVQSIALKVLILAKCESGLDRGVVRVLFFP
jgi:hypothetical protein